MPFDRATGAALTAVAAVMEDARDDWWLIGSGAVALHTHASVIVKDLDILLSVDDARRILPGLGLAVQPGEAHPQFCSEVFATWHELSIPVEFMAGFAQCTVNVWHPVLPQTRQSIAYGGGRIFVPEAWELRAILMQFGRPKDLERARLLVW